MGFFTKDETGIVTGVNPKQDSFDVEAIPEAEEQNYVSADFRGADNNIIFVGRREVVNKDNGKLEKVTTSAGARISDGETVIELPTPEEQKAGFYHAQAAQIIALFPADYKPVISKG